MEQSAGIFLIRKDNKLFVGHPTNEHPEKWSIPKGRLNKDEHPTEAAVREMFEESNIDVSKWKILHNLDPVKYKNKEKILIPFVLFEKQNDIDFDTFNPKCNSNVPEEIGGYPEMDDFKWITLDEAKKILYQTQINCIHKIEEILEKLTNNRSKLNP